MRTLTHDVAEFNEGEIAMMASQGVTGNEVREFIRTSGPQSMATAIGGIQMLRNGQGQERNEPFAPADDAVGEYHVAGELADVEPVVSEPAV